MSKLSCARASVFLLRYHNPQGVTLNVPSTHSGQWADTRMPSASESRGRSLQSVCSQTAFQKKKNRHCRGFPKSQYRPQSATSTQEALPTPKTCIAKVLRNRNVVPTLHPLRGVVQTTHWQVFFSEITNDIGGSPNLQARLVCNIWACVLSIRFA